MGQKTHPYGFRLGIVKDWKSRWYAESKDFPRLLMEDETLRKYLHQRLGHAVELRLDPTQGVVPLHRHAALELAGAEGTGRSLEAIQAAQQQSAQHPADPPEQKQGDGKMRDRRMKRLGKRDHSIRL